MCLSVCQNRSENPNTHYISIVSSCKSHNSSVVLNVVTFLLTMISVFVFRSIVNIHFLFMNDESDSKNNVAHELNTILL